MLAGHGLQRGNHVPRHIGPAGAPWVELADLLASRPIQPDLQLHLVLLERDAPPVLFKAEVLELGHGFDIIGVEHQEYVVRARRLG